AEFRGLTRVWCTRSARACFKILPVAKPVSSFISTLVLAMAQEHGDVANGGGSENGSSKTVSFFCLKPQLFVPAPKAADAIQFYKSAFGAEELKRIHHPKRKAEQEQPIIISAELKLGSSVFIVADYLDDNSKPTGGADFAFCLETDDVDGAVSKAVDAGATVEGKTAEDEGECCGVRAGRVKDPYGFIWAVCAPAKKGAADVAADLPRVMLFLSAAFILKCHAASRIDGFETALGWVVIGSGCVLMRTLVRRDDPFDGLGVSNTASAALTAF
ncbi:hypothetical protein ACLOJK_023984, partial [Asimina triloba]